MKDIGRKLKAIQVELGVSPMRVAAEANLHIQTLYKVYGNKEVKPETLSKVRNALTKLKGNLAS